MGQKGSKRRNTTALRSQNFRGAVGYVKLPTHTARGSHEFYSKQATNSARASMQSIVGKYSRLLMRIDRFTPEMLTYALQPTFDFSQIYCPVDTGMLADSGRLFTEKVGSSQRAWITYGGGGSIHYAAIVHERTDLQHDTPTRSKYLQAAMEDTLPLIKTRLQEALTKFTQTGGV